MATATHDMLGFTHQMVSSPTQKNVRAIENLEASKDKKEHHTFLGMATYISSVNLHVAYHNAPLRNLLKENIDFA